MLAYKLSLKTPLIEQYLRAVNKGVQRNDSNDYVMVAKGFAFQCMLYS